MIKVEMFLSPPEIVNVSKITKEINGIFTNRHNLGLMSNPMDNLLDAKNYYKNISCDRDIYLFTQNGNIYVSSDILYNPVIRAFVSKQVTFHEVIYRWNQVSPTGILLKSVILNE